MLEAAANESEVLTLLRENPQKLAERFGLGPEELHALRGSDLLLMRVQRDPLLRNSTTTYTFDTGTTIGGTTTYTFDTGTTISRHPTRLEDLDKDRLIEVLRQTLTDPACARRLSDFLDL